MARVPFYEMPFVKELLEIFENPERPTRVTEQQFDGQHGKLRKLASTPWEQFEPTDCDYYLMNLTYEEEHQQELFDYLFPGILAVWADGLRVRVHQPAGGSDIYKALWRGRLLSRMMSADRRARVEAFMASQFIDAVCRMQPESKASVSGMSESGNYQFFLRAFNALGQSVPVSDRIWKGLCEPVTTGSTRFWLPYLAGLCYRSGTVPWIEPWTCEKGGGGVYILESETEIYETGYLEANLLHMNAVLSLKSLHEIARQCADTDIEPHERERLALLKERMSDAEEYVTAKVNWYLLNLAAPDLGGVMQEF